MENVQITSKSHIRFHRYYKLEIYSEELEAWVGTDYSFPNSGDGDKLSEEAGKMFAKRGIKARTFLVQVQKSLMDEFFPEENEEEQNETVD